MPRLEVHGEGALALSPALTTTAIIIMEPTKSPNKRKCIGTKEIAARTASLNEGTRKQWIKERTSDTINELTHGKNERNSRTNEIKERTESLNERMIVPTNERNERMNKLMNK